MTGPNRMKGRAGPADVWLAIETATPVGSVAIWKDGLAFEESLRIQGGHSELVLPTIDRALEVTGTLPEDVSALVIGSGPGSFTGVRIVASMAKGWAMARGTPLFAYSSLLATAAGSGVDGPICALFDARRNQVYAACYDFSRGRPIELLPPAAWRLDELLAQLSRLGIRPTFAGEGALVYGASLRESLPGACLLPEHLGTPRAASLLWLRDRVPDLGRIADPDAWEPLYLRDWKVPEEGKTP